MVWRPFLVAFRASLSTPNQSSADVTGTIRVVGAEQARLPQHVLAVEAELDVDVEREGVELAVDDPALPQPGVVVPLAHAVLGQQIDVPGVQEAARREAGDPADVHHAEVGCPVAGGGHGELGVKGVAPLEVESFTAMSGCAAWKAFSIAIMLEPSPPLKRFQ